MFSVQLHVLRRIRLGSRTLQSAIRRLTTVPDLGTSNLETFQARAFRPGLPFKFDLLDKALIETCRKWFRSNENSNFQLNQNFWTTHKDAIVPLEITKHHDNGKVTFERIEAPLELLLQSIEGSQNDSSTKISVYLAQHDLRDLPQQMQADLPTPHLVQNAGKGDLYNSSLWLGKAPTYTPFHRDPNPNILFQMAGKKLVRLFDPDTGSAIFDHVKQTVYGSRPAANRIRGEEMMVGPERNVLHDLVWLDKIATAEISRYCHEAILEPEQALFIPQGWWHSVKGIGNGVTASANWWFR